MSGSTVMASAKVPLVVGDNAVILQHGRVICIHGRGKRPGDGQKYWGEELALTVTRPLEGVMFLVFSC